MQSISLQDTVDIKTKPITYDNQGIFSLLTILDKIREGGVYLYGIHYRLYLGPVCLYERKFALQTLAGTYFPG